MCAFNERSLLGIIEFYELSGRFTLAKILRAKFNKNKEKFNQQKEFKMTIKKNQVFEGTLVAAGWDKLDHINQSSLYTQDDEDILLEHGSGIKKFKPFLNQKVRISGDIVSTMRDGRRVMVKKISRLARGLTTPITQLQ